ncbi:MAG: dCMP hydroxymethylase [Flavobacteriaceae bacterium]|nr:dCMP hydroxymethylase [Flavobacteriaceae bacterium]
MLKVNDIRSRFADKLVNKDFIIDKSGVKLLEIIGASFIVDQPSIFREPNMDYVSREIKWYNSQSLNVNDIPGNTPKIWQQVADKDGFINSNYGWCIFNEDNGNQYENTLTELLSNPNSRRAIMIYNRPSMHEDYNKNGMSDFMCTNAVQYLIRNNELNAIVQMRSNDSVFGFLNDYQWQLYVLNLLTNNINSQKSAEEKIGIGNIYWNAGSLHVYERHFDLVQEYIDNSELEDYNYEW